MSLPLWYELVQASGRVYQKHPFEISARQRRYLRTFIAAERIRRDAEEV